MFTSYCHRAVVLWKGDSGLLLALTVARKFVAHTEFLITLWPNECTSRYYVIILAFQRAYDLSSSLRAVLRTVWHRLRYMVVEACLKAGVVPPSLDLPRRPETNKGSPALSSSSGSPSASVYQDGNMDDLIT